MAGLNRKLLVIKVATIFLIGYFLFLLPQHVDIPYIDSYHLQFLNYDIYAQFGYFKGSMSFIVLFILLFYFIYHSQISVLSENTSYLSMVFTRFKRKEIIYAVLKDSLIDNGIAYITGICCVILLDIISNFIVYRMIMFSLIEYVMFSIYYFKIIIYIYVITSGLRLMTFVKNTGRYTIYGYIGFIVALMLDLFLNTRFIGMSCSASQTIIWCLVDSLLSLFILYRVIRKFLKEKEFYYD
ncbi:hypothetical protein [Anaerorhabdus sp.]|jgi:hypothetical protein|uniref:hypothetical protein n=1 Tax=Anaerorhabdus sp. TaxID=1872524 RepID=UPI002FC67034